MRNSTDIEHLLDQAGSPLDHPCDLDLLCFFRRHPRALLTSEQLAAFVAYDVQQVGRSLDTLIGAGLLTQSQNPKSGARMYVLTSGGPLGDWLTSLLEVAATPAGRRALSQALPRRHWPGGAPGAGGKRRGSRTGPSGGASQEDGYG